MIVELVGPPGAGKTYLAPTLAARCGTRVIKIGRLGQRYFYFTLYALGHRELVREVHREIRRQERNHPELRAVKKWRRFMSMGAKVAKARLLGGGLIDEGVFQAVLKMFEDKAAPEEFERYLRLIRRPPDQVYFVETPGTLRYERMEARKDFPRRYLGEENWNHWHESFVANAETLKPILLARYNAEICKN